MSQYHIVTCDILLEFLEIAFHSALYSRNLYPTEIFVKKKIYGTTVYISEHPEVKDYIKNILEAVKELIIYDGTSIKKINLIFQDRDEKPVQKFIFNLSRIRVEAVESDPYFLKTEEALRTLFLKLLLTKSYLQPLPEGSSFSIEIEARESAHLALNENPKCENFPWIIEEPSAVLKNTELLPLTTINTEYLNLQLFVTTFQSSRNFVTIETLKKIHVTFEFQGFAAIKE